MPEHIIDILKGGGERERERERGGSDLRLVDADEPNLPILF
jgi:hypothetical protein